MKPITPLKAIRAKCLDCSGNSKHEIKLCQIPDCPLFAYRFGKNPNRKGIGGRTGQTQAENQETVTQVKERKAIRAI